MRDEPVVQGGFAHPACGFILLERIMRRVKKAEAFGNALAQIFAVNLERHIAADIDGPQVCGRNTIADPVRHDLAHAARGLQADGIEASGHKAAV